MGGGVKFTQWRIQGCRKDLEDGPVVDLHVLPREPVVLATSPVFFVAGYRLGGFAVIRVVAPAVEGALALPLAFLGLGFPAVRDALSDG